MKKSRLKTCVGSLIIGCLLIAISLPATAAVNINPEEMRGLRNGPVTEGATLLLDFSAVKTPTEDRTVAHFDISGLTNDFISATLNIGINNIDPGAPQGTLDVYSFTGDGTVSIDEWALGSLFHTFSGIDGEVQTLTINIDTLLSSAITGGATYLSFNLRTTDSDRYWLNSTIGGVTSSISGEGPTFMIVDAPPTVTITRPVDGVVIGASPVDVSGTFTGEVDTIDVNGVQAALGIGIFTATGVPLQEGSNTLTATAADAFDERTATASVQVTLTTASDPGDTVGTEFRVNTTTTDEQFSPSVGLDAEGNFVITWVNFEQSGIDAQRYSADGMPQGGEFRVNTTTANGQISPSIALDADGDFVITWTRFEQTENTNIYAQRKYQHLRTALQRRWHAPGR
jgi:hypothetical protein